MKQWMNQVPRFNANAPDLPGTMDSGSSGGGAPAGDPDNGTGGDSWREGLPPELVAAPFIRSAASLEQAIADITHAADTTGNSLRIPGPDASPESIAEFHAKVQEKAPGLMPKPNRDDPDGLMSVLKALGMPDEANAYQAGGELSDTRLGELQAMAHTAGLTQTQFKQLTEQMVSKELEATTQAQGEMQAGIDRLKGEWGNAYDTRMEKILKMAELTGAPDGLVDAIKSGEVGADYVQWFYNQADSLGGGEGQTITNQGKGEPAPVMTPAEALAQLSEVEQRLFDRDCPADQKPYLVQKRMELMGHAYPNSSQDGLPRAGL